MLLRPAAERPTVKQLRKDLRLKERFGIGEHMFREYARQVQAGDNGPMCGPLVTAMAHLLKVPVEQGEVLQEVAFVLLMMRLAKMLNDGGLTPEQVVKLADAMAKGQAAQTRAVERRLAEKRFRREGNQMRRPQVESQEGAERAGAADLRARYGEVHAVGPAGRRRRDNVIGCATDVTTAAGVISGGQGKAVRPPGRDRGHVAGGSLLVSQPWRSAKCGSGCWHNKEVATVSDHCVYRTRVRGVRCEGIVIQPYK